MAKFRVGQRVRIVAGPFAGEQGVVMGAWGQRHGYPERLDIPFPWDVRPDGRDVGPYRSSELAPLADPSAERCIESIKRLGREPINDAPKVTVAK